MVALELLAASSILHVWSYLIVLDNDPGPNMIEDENFCESIKRTDFWYCSKTISLSVVFNIHLKCLDTTLMRICRFSTPTVAISPAFARRSARGNRTSCTAPAGLLKLFSPPDVFIRALLGFVTWSHSLTICTHNSSRLRQRNNPVSYLFRWIPKRFQEGFSYQVCISEYLVVAISCAAVPPLWDGFRTKSALTQKARHCRWCLKPGATSTAWKWWDLDRPIRPTKS